MTGDRYFGFMLANRKTTNKQGSEIISFTFTIIMMNPDDGGGDV